METVGSSDLGLNTDIKTITLSQCLSVELIKHLFSSSFCCIFLNVYIFLDHTTSPFFCVFVSLQTLCYTMPDKEKGI